MFQTLKSTECNFYPHHSLFMVIFKFNIKYQYFYLLKIKKFLSVEISKFFNTKKNEKNSIIENMLLFKEGYQETFLKSIANFHCYLVI